MTEIELVAAARGGDAGAFERLVAPHRGELFGHCYRMLGSSQDAEDTLQEVLLRAWRGMARFEGRSSVRTWLHTIASTASLRTLERRPPRALPLDHGPEGDLRVDLAAPLAETVWLEPAADAQLGLAAEVPEARYDRRESVELAFVAALQGLPARQRAVLVLRDVLGFSGAEVAAALGTSTDAVHSTLQRAHRTVDDRLPAQSQQAALRAIGDRELAALVGAYTDAWERGDVAALAALLTEDAVVAMPPYAEWYRGRDAVLEFLARRPLAPGRRWAMQSVGLNGQLGFAQREAVSGAPHSVSVLALRAGRIADMTAFLVPALVDRLAPPARRSAA